MVKSMNQRVNGSAVELHTPYANGESLAYCLAVREVNIPEMESLSVTLQCSRCCNLERRWQRNRCVGGEGYTLRHVTLSK